MIGFEEVPVSEKGHPNEGPETKDLSKKALFKMLDLKYFMPPLASRGVTRSWLVDVHDSKVYRVLNMDLKTFEVQLTPSMSKRVGILNNCFLARKINTLLASKNLKTLGFDEYDPPEEVSCHHQAWLYRLVRYLDPTNLLEFFESPVEKEKPLDNTATKIQGVHWGRIKASQHFFRLAKAKADRKLWDQIKDLSTCYKAYLLLVAPLALAALAGLLQSSETLLSQVLHELAQISGHFVFLWINGTPLRWLGFALGALLSGLKRFFLVSVACLGRAPAAGALGDAGGELVCHYNLEKSLLKYRE